MLALPPLGLLPELTTASYVYALPAILAVACLLIPVRYALQRAAARRAQTARKTDTKATAYQPPNTPLHPDAASYTPLPAPGGTSNVMQEPDIVLIISVNGEVLQTNSTLATLLGIPEDHVVYQNITTLLTPQHWPAWPQAFAAAQKGQAFQVSGPIRHRAGNLLHFQASLTKISQEEPELTYLLRLRDITRLHTLTQKLSQTEQQLKDFSSCSADWLWETDAHNRFTFHSPGILKVLGYPSESIINQSLVDVLFSQADDSTQAVRALITARIEHQQPFREIEFWCNTLHMQKVCLRISGLPVLTNGKLSGYRGAISNITAQQAERQHVHRLGKTDHLTGLHNAQSFKEGLDRAIGLARRHQTQGVVALIDLDRFKEINDTHGHAAGDQILLAVRDLLQTNLRDTDLVARRGGDEFSVVMHNVDLPTATAKIQKILAQVAALNITYRGNRLSTTMSVGMVQYPQDDKSAEHLIMAADLAMYRAKDMGRNRVYVDAADATEATAGSVRSQLKWVNRLKHCLETGEFEMFYQAIVPARKTARPLFEALLRIYDEDGKVASPALYIDAAEHFGLIQSLDLAVVDRVFATQAKLKGQGVLMDISINLSCRTLGDPAVVPRLKELVTKHKVDTTRIIFEVTETMALHDPAQMRDIDEIKKFIIELRNMGFRFALDDFGTGFTSFRYLKVLPVDVVKIDGEYIKELATSAEDQLFVRSMVELCQGLGIATIAEFVENEAIVAKLLEYGVDYGQGWLFAKPQADLPALVGTYTGKLMDDYREKPLLAQVQAAPADSPAPSVAAPATKPARPKKAKT